LSHFVVTIKNSWIADEKIGPVLLGAVGYIKLVQCSLQQNMLSFGKRPEKRNGQISEKGNRSMNVQLFRRKDKRRTFFITGLVVLLIIGGFVGFQSRKQSAANPAANKLQTTVDVMTVARTGLLKRISLTGQTVPESQVDIAAKYQGKIVAVYAQLGQQVNSGQVLVVQDTGDADIAIKQSQAAYKQSSADAVTTESTFMANYDKANADYQKARGDYDRNKALYRIGGVSREALDASQQSLADAKAGFDALANQMNSDAVSASIESAQAVAQKAQYTINANEKQRDDLILRAPRSGIIGYRQVEVGALVQAGTKLLSIVDNSNIYVDCQVSEQDLSALKIGMDVDVQIESLGRSFAGKIIYISPSVDPSTLAFSLRIGLNNSDETVRSGMFTKTVINSVLRPDAIAVPKDAVLDKNGKSYVYIINLQNAAEERIVQVGARSDQNVEILGGLKEGEQIAVSNLARLRNGLGVIPRAIAADRSDGQ